MTFASTSPVQLEILLLCPNGFNGIAGQHKSASVNANFIYIVYNIKDSLLMLRNVL